MSFFGLGGLIAGGSAKTAKKALGVFRGSAKYIGPEEEPTVPQEDVAVDPSDIIYLQKLLRDRFLKKRKGRRSTILELSGKKAPVRSTLQDLFKKKDGTGQGALEQNKISTLG